MTEWTALPRIADEPAAPPHGERLNVLLVDDEVGNLQALEAVLAADDIELVQARSGPEALRAVLEREYALILLDIFMPGMDGFEVAELIRGREQTRETPIIFLTAAAGNELAVSRGYALGAVDYLIKPVDPAILRYKVAVFTDLYRKTAQVQRQAEEMARGRAFVNSVLDGVTSHAIAALDERGRFVVWNEGAHRMYGRSAKDALGMHFDVLFPTDEVIGGLPADLLTRPDEERREVEVRQVRADGESFPACLTLSERRNHDGVRDGHVLTVLDETATQEAEAVRAQLLLEQSARRQAELAQRRMQQMINVLPEPVVIAVRDGRLALLNHAARDILGPLEPGTDLVTGNPLGMVRGDGNAFDDGALPLRRVFVDRTVVRGEEAVLTAGDRPIPVLVNAAPVLDDEGEVIGGIVALQDISRLKELDRLKDDFLGTISHDMKAPLAVISGTAQLLQRRVSRLDIEEPGRIQELLRSIYRTSMRAAAIVNELTDLARAPVDLPLDLRCEPLDLTEIARDVVMDMQALSERHRILLVGEPGATGEWDRGRLERAVANLLENAVKFSPDGGDVVVQVGTCQETESGEWAVLTVTDHGVGIAPEELPQVFSRFYRGANVGAIAGSGIGLASVQQVVSAHGGRVSLESEPGCGTTVRLELPRGSALRLETEEATSA